MLTMDTHFTPITDTEALDALFASSAERPVILFKHDPYCPISARAHREMSHVAGDVAIIDVAHDHTVKNAVTERTGIRHESPQVIVLRDGKAVWSASQFHINADGVAQAVQGDETARP
jgi:bacillithiol system protein YtxJ